MEKQTKITYVLSGLTILSVILHNAIFGFLKTEEPVFFILTLVFGFGFTISVIYDVILVLKKRGPKDLWKLGFLGFVGLLGLIPGLNIGFFGLFGFFGFFGAKRWKDMNNIKQPLSNNIEDLIK